MDIEVHRVARYIAHLTDPAVAQPLEPGPENGFYEHHADGMICHVRVFDRTNIFVPHQQLAGFATIRVAEFAPK